MRVTYERFGNQSFGLTPPDPDGYFLQRYLLQTDPRAGSRVRVWTEFNSGLENGRFGGPRPVIDEDKLDLHQAFVDVAVAATSPSAAVFASAATRSRWELDACTPSQPETRARTATTN